MKELKAGLLEIKRADSAAAFYEFMSVEANSHTPRSTTVVKIILIHHTRKNTTASVP
jgi:hypothetical protein